MRIVFGAVLTSTAAATWLSAWLYALYEVPPPLVLVVGCCLAFATAAAVRALSKPTQMFGQRLSLWLPAVGVGLTLHAVASFSIVMFREELRARQMWFNTEFVVQAAPVFVVFAALAIRSVMTSFYAEPVLKGPFLEKRPMSSVKLWMCTTLTAFCSTGGVMAWWCSQMEMSGLIEILLWFTGFAGVCLVVLLAVAWPLFIWPLMSVLHKAARAERSAA
jgi:hypothetical protein